MAEALAAPADPAVALPDPEATELPLDDPAHPPSAQAIKTAPSTATKSVAVAFELPSAIVTSSPSNRFASKVYKLNAAMRQGEPICSFDLPAMRGDHAWYNRA